MSTCILTGFAKKKTRIGTSYACDGSDLPATQTLSAVQVSGPYETTPSLPATTVTYTIIGNTPCGDTIRRISTKTYSSRSVANQYKALFHYDNSTTIIPIYSSINHTLLPNNTGQIRAWVIANTPTTVIDVPTYGGATQTRLDPPNDTHDLFGNIQVIYCTNPGGPGCTVHFVEPTTTLTLYYLDVHEVLTYDLV